MGKALEAYLDEQRRSGCIYVNCFAHTNFEVIVCEINRKRRITRSSIALRRKQSLRIRIKTIMLEKKQLMRKEDKCKAPPRRLLSFCL